MSVKRGFDFEKVDLRQIVGRKVEIIEYDSEEFYLLSALDLKTLETYNLQVIVKNEQREK